MIVAPGSDCTTGGCRGSATQGPSGALVALHLEVRLLLQVSGCSNLSKAAMAYFLCVCVCFFLCVCVCVCVCVCICVGQSEGMCMCVCVYVCFLFWVCVCKGVRARTRACVCSCSSRLPPLWSLGPRHIWFNYPPSTCWLWGPRLHCFALTSCRFHGCLSIHAWVCGCVCRHVHVNITTYQSGMSCHEHRNDVKNVACLECKRATSTNQIKHWYYLSPLTTVVLRPRNTASLRCHGYPAVAGTVDCDFDLYNVIEFQFGPYSNEVWSCAGYLPVAYPRSGTLEANAMLKG